VISDTQPRSNRVPRTVDVEETGVTGIDTVVIGVQDLEPLAETIAAVLGLEPPENRSVDDGAMTVSRFTDSPVVLATPETDSGWLAERIDRYGAGVCAFVLGADRPERVADTSHVVAESTWFDRPIRWLDTSVYGGAIGVADH